MEYLGRVLEYALRTLQKLSAEAKEVEMKKAHDKLLLELAAIAHSENKEKNSFVIAVVRGLRFVLEEIQVFFFSDCHYCVEGVNIYLAHTRR